MKNSNKNLYTYDINNFLCCVGDLCFYKGKFRRISAVYLYVNKKGVKSCRLRLNGIIKYVDYKELFL